MFTALAGLASSLVDAVQHRLLPFGGSARWLSSTHPFLLFACHQFLHIQQIVDERGKPLHVALGGSCGVLRQPGRRAPHPRKRFGNGALLSTAGSKTSGIYIEQSDWIMINATNDRRLKRIKRAINAILSV
jgi:hypothetical protein